MSDTHLTRLLRGALASGAALGAFLVSAAAPAAAQGLAGPSVSGAAPAAAMGLAGPGAVFTATNDALANAVLAFRRDASGQLTPAGSHATGGLGSGGGLGNQGGVVVDRSGRFLFAVNAGDDSVSTFGIGAQGLQLLGVAGAGGAQPISVTTHGGLVYVLAAGGSGSIAGFRLAEDGSLAPLAGSTRPLSGAATGPAQVAFSPDGSFLVVTEKATNTIVTYALDPLGLPGDPVVTPSAGMTPFGFSFDQRSHLLVSEASGGAAGQSTVSSYDLLADGSLLPVTAALGTTQSAACWLVATPNGRHAYVTNTGSATVTGLSLEPSGALDLLQPGGVSASTGAAPIDAAVTRNGRFLYVLNGSDDTIDAFGIGADGSLTPLGTTGGLPASVNGLAAL